MISQPCCVCSVISPRFQLPRWQHGMTLKPMEIPYEIICALERMPPRNGFWSSPRSLPARCRKRRATDAERVEDAHVQSAMTIFSRQCLNQTE